MGGVAAPVSGMLGDAHSLYPVMYSDTLFCPAETENNGGISNDICQ